MQTSEARDVAQRLQVAGRKNSLHMSVTAGGTEIAHLVIECLPVARQHMLAGDDDIDFLGAIGDGGFDLAQLHVMRDQAGRKTGGDGCHRDTGPFERLDGGGNETMIDAHGTGRDTATAHADRIEQILAHRLARLGAEPLDALRRVVAIERREVDAGNGFQQPGGLRVLLHRAATGQRRNATLGGRQIDALVQHPAKIEIDAVVARPVMARRRRMRGLRRASFHSKVFQAMAP